MRLKPLSAACLPTIQTYRAPRHRDRLNWLGSVCNLWWWWFLVALTLEPAHHQPALQLGRCRRRDWFCVVQGFHLHISSVSSDARRSPVLVLFALPFRFVCVIEMIVGRFSIHVLCTRCLFIICKWEHTQPREHQHCTCVGQRLYRRRLQCARRWKSPG